MKKINNFCMQYFNSSMFMKGIRYTTFVPFLCLSFWVVYQAPGCKPTQKQPVSNVTEETQIEFDTARKILIDTLVNRINKEVRKKGLPNKLAYQVYNPVDTIYYWIVDRHSARISIEMSPPQMTMWPTFFVYFGDLVMVRYRHMNQVPPDSYAYESMIYLRDGKIVYCDERRMDLKEGDFPGMLRQMSFSKSTRSYEEIEKDYKEYWITIVDYMKAHHTLPPEIRY